MQETPRRAQLPEKGDEDALYLVDISSFIFRAYHALPPLSSSKGEPTHAVKGVTQMFRKLIDELDPKRIIVAMDSKAPTFRKELFEAYKANRPPPPPDLSMQIERILELVTVWGMNPIGIPGFEADDIIATCAVKARAAGLKVVIVSADKDLLQLIDEETVMYDTMRGTIFGEAETIERMGVPPEQVRDLLALMGDSSDNIPGVPSVGAKTAAKFLGKYGSLEGIYENIEDFKGKTKERLIENRDVAFLSRELVALKDDMELPFDPTECRFDGGDLSALRRIFAELEFTALMASLEPSGDAVEADYALIEDAEELERFLIVAREKAELGVHCLIEGGNPHHARAHVIGLAFDSGLSRVVRLDDEKIIAALKPVLENSLIRKYSDDIKRDDLALRAYGVRLRGHDFDTMLASYLLDPSRSSHGIVEVVRAELGEEIQSDEQVLGKGAKRLAVNLLDDAALLSISATRADYALRLARVMGDRMREEPFATLYHNLELPLAHVLADIEAAGVRLDTELLNKMSADVGEQIDALKERCYELAGREFNVGSPRQLEVILFDELNLPVQKRTKTGRSTDQSVLEDLSLLHELPETILEYRSLSKLKSTYLDLLPREVNAETGRVHTSFNQAVAATGRLSSSDPNLQNIPIRTELGRKIRDAFIPRDGWVILAADYSQIELRILAHLSKDEALVEAYTTGADVHRQTASALFGVPVEEVDREMRARAKTVNFAVIYGQTEFALARNLKIERSEARRYIEAFFERYKGVARYMEESAEEARRTGYAKTILERRRSIPDLNSENRNLRAAAERIARNTPIQGSAADIIKRAMVDLHEAMRRARYESRILLTVHDELVFEIAPDERDELEPLIREKMEGAAQLDLPLTVEIGYGKNWGEAH